MSSYSSKKPEIMAVEDTSAFKRLANNLTKNTLWLYVLRLLKTRPYYGYELRKALEEHFSIKTTRVTSYVILKKLQNEDLVTEVEHEEESLTGKPARIYYLITPLGEQLLELAAKFIEGVYSRLFSELPELKERI